MRAHTVYSFSNVAHVYSFDVTKLNIFGNMIVRIGDTESLTSSNLCNPCRLFIDKGWGWLTLVVNSVIMKQI
jgi:hypothetical protein